MSRWQLGWAAWRRRRALKRRAIDDSVWAHTLDHYPFLSFRGAADVARLRTLTSLFLDQKEFAGMHGLAVSNDMAVSVAAQACLPVLELGLAPYRDFVGIVMHPGEVVASRSVQDEHGLVHQYDEVIAGEAMERGPIMLSWADAQGRSDASEAYNVVIHEFAHVLDMHWGVTRASALTVSLQTEFDRFSERVVCGHETLLDPYGAQSLEEYFAVASETFFVTPGRLAAEHPALYDALRRVYRQDPAAWHSKP